MIEVKNLKKIYNGVTVLDIPSLEIKPGESFGLVGNNGAGKTTFFRLILDLILPDEGAVFSKSQSVSETEDWKRYTGSLLDSGFLIEYLTPDEYFEFLAHLNHIPEEDLTLFLTEFSDFFNDEILGKKKYIRDLSKGNQQKVGIAAALMANPEIVILDEPYASLDPSTQIRLSRLLQKKKSEHRMTQLISSHDLNHVTEVCNRIVILDKGRIVKDLPVYENTLKELQEYFMV